MPAKQNKWLNCSISNFPSFVPLILNKCTLPVRMNKWTYTQIVWTLYTLCSWTYIQIVWTLYTLCSWTYTQIVWAHYMLCSWTHTQIVWTHYTLYVFVNCTSKYCTTLACNYIAVVALFDIYLKKSHTSSVIRFN